MLTIFLVGIPVILVNMLLQSLVSVWCIRFYVKRFNRREGPWPACWLCLASSPW